MATIDQPRELSKPDFRRFRDYIYRLSGITLPDGKRTLLQSRLQKRLMALGLASYSEYFQFLQSQDPNGVELQEMINRVTTNKTHFFREQHHFDYLRDVVFRSLIEQAEQGTRPKKLRIWSAACSTGEEPYSIAMTAHDTFAQLGNWDIRILASDIDTNVIKTAETGVYHRELVDDLDRQTVQRHFSRHGDRDSESLILRPALRDMIAFRQINFADPSWPIHTKFDAIFCRNVLIYFNSDTQDKLVRRLADYMQPDASLFIGHSESLTRTSDLFKRTGTTVFGFVDSRNGSLPQTASSTAMTPARSATKLALANVPQGTACKRNPQLRRLIVGDVFATENPITVTSTLGSCIAACLYDPVARIGGMNHFALPEARSSSRTLSSFGVNAMELLINRILQLGGARHRLQAKVFGAATFGDSDKAGSIGPQNEKFIRSFLDTEKIPLIAECLGGNAGMQVLFETATGRARLKLLNQQAVLQANQESKRIKMPPADITLF